MVRRGLFKGNDRDRWTDCCNEVLQWKREPGLSAENDKEKWEFKAKEQGDEVGVGQWMGTRGSSGLGPGLWQHGETQPECWNRGQIQDLLWCPPRESGEENLNQPASQVHLLLLWQDQDEETSCGHLGLWFLHESGSRWCLDLQPNLCCHREVCHQKSPGLKDH